MGEGGVPNWQRAWGVDALLLYATAQAAEHSAQHRSADSGRKHQELESAIRNAQPARYPAIAEVSAELLGGAPRGRYEWGIRSLLAGIASTPTPA